MLPNFNNSKMQVSLTHHGCYGGVVKACYDTCLEPVAFVHYSTVGSDFVITSFAVHPYSTAKEAQLAGDLIDSALELEALKHGIKQLLIVPPGRDTAEFVLEYKAKPFVTCFGHNTNPIAHVN